MAGKRRASRYRSHGADTFVMPHVHLSFLCQMAIPRISGFHRLNIITASKDYLT
jgi:hypothetical protein